MILDVSNLSHGFGDRAIFNNVSFRLLKGEHIGLVGANGEGKSTFMNIVTGKLQPDEGSVEWAKNVRVGYLDQHRDVTDLSGGQRTKLLLAKLLLEKPDILLLDEPTNYLDANHIVWLKRYLQEYENAFILISHDIPFLNDVVNLIYHMENQELNRYVGNYDKFLEVYEMKKMQLEALWQETRRMSQQEIWRCPVRRSSTKWM